jgi:rhodanese-related sulfurtransferase
VVYPAHDYRHRKPSSLKRQKQTNPHLKKRTREEFIRYLEELKLGPAEWMKDVLKANYTCAQDPKAAWIPIDTPSCEVKGTLEPGVNDIQVSSIPVNVLKEKIDSDAVPLLVDVREPEELNREPGHIEGIVNIPIGNLTQQLSELEKAKEKEIVIICRSGARAHTAAQILIKSGFSRVNVLNGGMLSWKSQ